MLSIELLSCLEAAAVAAVSKLHGARDAWSAWKDTNKQVIGLKLK